MIFFTKNPNLKRKKNWEWGGLDRRTDEQAKTNLPLQLEVGA